MNKEKRKSSEENFILTGFLRIKVIKLDLIHYKIIHNDWILTQENAENSTIFPKPFCVINFIDLNKHVEQLKIRSFQYTGCREHLQNEYTPINEGVQNIGRYTI